MTENSRSSLPKKWVVGRRLRGGERTGKMVETPEFCWLESVWENLLFHLEKICGKIYAT